MCTNCYQNAKRHLWYKPHPRPILVPTCHPERPYNAKGLCRECYDRTKFLERKERDAFYWRVKKLRRYGYTGSIEPLWEGGCWLCGRKDDLHIDHDHETNRFRGLLCEPHNQGLGHFDKGDMFHRLAKYLGFRLVPLSYPTEERAS